MKRLVRIILIVCLLSSVAVFSGGKVLAFNPNNPTGAVPGTDAGSTTTVCNNPDAAKSAYCTETQNPKDKFTGSNGLLAKIVNIVSLIGGIAAIVMILAASIRFMTSSGETEAVKSAKGMLMYALIGIVILALAQIIVKFIISKAP